MIHVESQKVIMKGVARNLTIELLHAIMSLKEDLIEKDVKEFNNLLKLTIKAENMDDFMDIFRKEYEEE